MDKEDAERGRCNRVDQPRLRYRGRPEEQEARQADRERHNLPRLVDEVQPFLERGDPKRSAQCVYRQDRGDRECDRPREEVAADPIVVDERGRVAPQPRRYQEQRAVPGDLRKAAEFLKNVNETVSTASRRATAAACRFLPPESISSLRNGIAR